jgi:hypothetical protein
MHGGPLRRLGVARNRKVARRPLAESPHGLVLDPFGGCGTTALAAALRGRDAVFAEVNPYLAWIADVKIPLTR